MPQKISIIILIVVALIAIGAGIALRDGTEMSDNAAQVPIRAEFDGKVVYTTDMGVDKIPLQAHCLARGGVFNECGSQCAPDADFCVTVCALTCENLTD